MRTNTKFGIGILLVAVQSVQTIALLNGNGCAPNSFQQISLLADGNNSNRSHLQTFLAHRSTSALTRLDHGSASTQLWAYYRRGLSRGRANDNDRLRRSRGSRRDRIRLPLDSTMEATTERQKSPPPLGTPFSLKTVTAQERERASNNGNNNINNNNNNKRDHDDKGTDKKSVTTSNIVATADGKIDKSCCANGEYPLLSKMDSIFHASSHTEKQNLLFMDGNDDSTGLVGSRTSPSDLEEEFQLDYTHTQSINYKKDGGDDFKLISSLRKSLEDAGFERLQERDLRLCEALNSGYLLRLSISPDVSKLDPCIGNEFYPEMTQDGLDKDDDDEEGTEFLFDGRILVFRRGYSSETTTGRLLLPKFNYLQTSLVQRSSINIANRLRNIEKRITQTISAKVDNVSQSINNFTSEVIESIPSEVQPVKNAATNLFNASISDEGLSLGELNSSIGKGKKRKRKKIIRGAAKFRRYGGRLTRFVGSDLNDDLNPFVVNREKVEEGRLNGTLYSELLSGESWCEYDKINEKDDDNSEDDDKSSPPLKLIERVSIANLVDFFSRGGRRRLIKSFTSQSKLVEPTYEEVVVVWRPLPEKKKKKRVKLPNFLYEVAEIFAIEDRLPKKEDAESEPKPKPLEIRAFVRVPMANLLAIFPKTKLVFRPADAFILDLVNVFSLLAVLASQKFDSPKLDLIAIVSVSLWTLRTFFRYSNKLARYDLLVNKFLTSRIAHRNEGALNYVFDEAAEQRAIRASLLHKWLLEEKKKSDDSMESLTKQQIITDGFIGMNKLTGCEYPVDVDVHATLDDLIELQLISFSADGNICIEVKDFVYAEKTLESRWLELFQNM